MDAVIRKAIKVAGGVRKLSRKIGVTHAAILGWHRVPAERVMAIEAATGIPRSVIRPDIFPPERERNQ
jgi:DNA-binding transcriptional regulator YdaS (Cro superfamily)